jgi:hypothetical protein
LKGDGVNDVKVPANLYNLIIVRHTAAVSVFNKKNNQGFPWLEKMMLISIIKPHNSFKHN